MVRLMKCNLEICYIYVLVVMVILPGRCQFGKTIVDGDHAHYHHPDHHHTHCQHHAQGHRDHVARHLHLPDYHHAHDHVARHLHGGGGDSLLLLLVFNQADLSLLNN